VRDWRVGVGGAVEWPDDESVLECEGEVGEMRRIMEWKMEGADWEKSAFM